MRYTTGADELPETREIQVRCELCHAQVVGAKRNDHIGGNRFVTQLVVIPDATRRLQNLLSDHHNRLSRTSAEISKTEEGVRMSKAREGLRHARNCDRKPGQSVPDAHGYD